MSANRQYCTFVIKDMLFGVDVLKVQEVIRNQRMTRVPLAPPVITGLINLRGQIVTAIDMRQRLELSNDDRPESPMNVIVSIGDSAVSLVVDSISDVIELGDDTFENPPETLRDVARELVSGVHKLKDRLLLILDCEKTINLQKVAEDKPAAVQNQPAPH